MISGTSEQHRCDPVCDRALANTTRVSCVAFRPPAHSAVERAMAEEYAHAHAIADFLIAALDAVFILLIAHVNNCFTFVSHFLFYLYLNQFNRRPENL